ncbi:MULTISPECIES: morphogenic membrane protein MmpA [Streptomyces]|uniref:Integral membrane protein n=1 Tax=Streptomyces solicathayae TaxID=3081768 RepID=A0ABZ0LNF9_9ACTN|nr:hypothetical protein [Streptomyces sp. HUAS YS2]WOX21033.1 hypothetical protein R2D22_06385 [Streptomyces sp. HUAS YS2]
MTTPTRVLPTAAALPSAPTALRRSERAMMSALAVAAVLAVCWLSAMIYIVGAWALAL